MTNLNPYPHPAQEHSLAAPPVTSGRRRERTPDEIRIRRASHDKENPYYLASRATAQDKALSYDALGMLNYILSKPDDWEVRPADLERKDCKSNKVYRVLRELLTAGYMERIYRRDEHGRVQLVEYIAHERPFEEAPLHEKQKVDNPQMENGDTTEYREKQNIENTLSPDGEGEPEPSQPKAKTPRKRDPLYDAIAEVWNSSASGYVVNIKAMLLGTAKRGTWKDCNFDPPVVDASEILAFGEYMRRRMVEKRITETPTAAVTVQRWFYDFRQEQNAMSGGSTGRGEDMKAALAAIGITEVL